MPTKKEHEPYIIYYPHSLPPQERVWKEDHYQVISIDPARKNYALRIEKRYRTGQVIPVVFDKVSFLANGEHGQCLLYNQISEFLDKYMPYLLTSHLCVIEKQLDVNYKIARIAQHTISYLSLLLRDKGRLLTIIEVDAGIKSRVLGAPRDLNVKVWAVQTARELLTARADKFSLGVMDFFGKKQDDLADTVCQVEALFLLWDLPSCQGEYPSRKGYGRGSCAPGVLIGRLVE